MEAKMSKKIAALVSILAYCMIIAAQEPAVDIDKKIHPNLAAAQQHIVEANREITTAQKDNKYDMKGHAEKARQLLVEANQELKAAAEAANAAGKKK
jgi:flagellar motility protein MotE (MotC chaperone)